MNTGRIAFRSPPLAPVGVGLRWLGRLLPKGLYARSLIIIIAPMVLLQSVIAYVFMERHWDLVTRRLSSAVTNDIAALIDKYFNHCSEGGLSAQGTTELTAPAFAPEGASAIRATRAPCPDISETDQPRAVPDP